MFQRAKKMISCKFHRIIENRKSGHPAATETPSKNFQQKPKKMKKIHGNPKKMKKKMMKVVTGTKLT
jgi:hypothetical protein